MMGVNLNSKGTATPEATPFIFSKGGRSLYTYTNTEMVLLAKGSTDEQGCVCKSNHFICTKPPHRRSLRDGI